MKNAILFSILLALVGCVHYQYEAKEELKEQLIRDSRLSRYDLVMGIKFVDATKTETTEAIKDDLASEITDWFVNWLDEGRNFNEVVNLNKNRNKKVDVILKGIIKSISVEEPGISGTSKALAIFYGVAPVVEHYAISKQITSSATVRFQLIEPKTYELLWDELITEKVKEHIQLSKSSKLILTSITKTVESLLTETQFPEQLDKIAQKQKASVTVATREEAPRPSLTAPSLQSQAISQRWAVVVGVSDYHDSRIPLLRYAADDAKSFYNWLTSPEGGRFPPSHVKLMVNEEATGHNIKEALFVWLKQALQEDMAIIFFAGHGSPESPDSPDNLFLLPYDAHYDNVATTGFPMWDIETALKRFIEAKKVVVIADACHAGGVGQSFDVARRASRGIEVNPISSGLQNLSKVGNGICVISASDEKQLSQESKDWGGGHGVFTYYLLKGLKGQADYSRDGKVTLGELIPYLSEQVRRATRSAQCPTVAGKFDPALTIGK